MKKVISRIFGNYWYDINTTGVEGVYNIYDQDGKCVSSFLAKSDNAIRLGEYDFYINEKIRQNE